MNFATHMRESVAKYLEDSPFDEDLWKSFAQGLFYMAGRCRATRTCTSGWRIVLKEVEQTRQTGGNILFYLSTQPSQYAPIAEGIGGGESRQRRRLAAHHHRKTFRPRSHQRAGVEPPGCKRFSTKARSIASITIWAKKRSRTSWRSASATESSSRCGTGATSITCRSRRRNRSAWKGAALTIRKPARCGT